MGVVRLYMSMSLDGFVATRDRDLRPLYPDLESLRHTEPLAEMIEATGAVVMGRRSYDLGDTRRGTSTTSIRYRSSWSPIVSRKCRRSTTRPRG
jgi:hypothetical protein